MAARRDILLKFLADDDASPKIAALNAELEETDVRANMASAALSKGGGGIPGLGLGITAVGGAAIGAGAALAALTKNYIENTKQAQRDAQVAGVNIESYSSLAFAAREYGIESEDLRAILSEQNLKVYEASDAWEELGFDMETVLRMKPDERLRAVVAALEGLDVENRKGIVDQIYGGDDGDKLLQLVGNLERLEDQAKATGNVIDEESARMAEDFDRNLGIMEAVLEGGLKRLAQGIVNTTAPMVEAFGEATGLLPVEAEDAAQKALDALLAKLTEAASAGKSYGTALMDPVIAELHRAVLEAGIAESQIRAVFDNREARERVETTGRRRGALGRETVAGDDDAASRALIEGFGGPPIPEDALESGLANINRDNEARRLFQEQQQRYHEHQVRTLLALRQRQMLESRYGGLDLANLVGNTGIELPFDAPLDESQLGILVKFLDDARKLGITQPDFGADEDQQGFGGRGGIGVGGGSGGGGGSGKGVEINIYVNGDERPLNEVIEDEVIRQLYDAGEQIRDEVTAAENCP